MYRVIKTTGKADYEYILINPRGEEINGGDGLHNKTALDIQAQLLIQEVAKRDEAWNETIDLKDARLRAQKETIDEQSEEITTLKAALNASNAELAEARKFVKKVANEKVVDADAMRNPYESAYRGYKAEAKNLVESWDSAAVAATTEDAPKSEYGFKVGDKVMSSAGGIGIIQAFLPDGYVRTSSFMALEIDLHPYEDESESVLKNTTCDICGGKTTNAPITAGEVTGVFCGYACIRKAKENLAPKFKVGDKVQRLGFTYTEVKPFDIVFMRKASGHYLLDKVYGTEDLQEFYESELIPYEDESESGE